MKTGMIGLGAMGKHMAMNLYKAGVLHKIWNRSRRPADIISQETGIEISQSPEEMAGQCELIIICVSNDEVVLDLVNRIATAVKPGTVVVDTSTVASATARKAAEILHKCDAHFLDCPVSGGVEGARNGTLVMMSGGDEAVLKSVEAVLAAIAGNIVYIGPGGSGQACKAVNQIMAAGINQAVTEALAFGSVMGLDMNKVVDVIATGAAGNWFLEHRGKTMLAGDYTPGFKLNLHHKDLVICRSMLQDSCEANLPIIEMTLLHYKRLMAEGLGDKDISALFSLKQQQLRQLSDQNG